MIEDHEIEVVIRDIGGNLLKVEKVPARAARVTVYVQTGNLTPLALDTGCRCDLQDSPNAPADWHGENCPCYRPRQ